MATFNDNQYKKLKKKIDIANKKIRILSKNFGDNSWGVHYLYNKINNDVVKGINKHGYIRVNKSMSDIQLSAIEKATNEFMTSKIGNVSGVKKAIKLTKKSLQGTLGDYKHPVSDRDINRLYDLVQDRDKRDITEQIGASTLWVETKHVKDKNLSFSRYVKNVDKRGDINITNKDDLNFLKTLFEDYTGKKILEEEVFSIMESLNIK